MGLVSSLDIYAENLFFHQGGVQVHFFSRRPLALVLSLRP
jgi:hypothetical protein